MLIEVRGLTKTFGGIHAVEGVDFEIHEGEITAIIGPNGAGKSTVFNLLCGFHKPSGGQVMFRGKDITGNKPHVTSKAGIARTFQTTKLFEQNTIVENVLAGCAAQTSSTLLGAVLRTPRFRREERESMEKTLELLDFVSIADYKDEIAGNAPQEVQKRAAVALALATNPSLLLLDEPAAGITEEETTRFGELIRKISSSGITVALVEHKMSLIMSLADRILVLERGRRIAWGTPDDVRNDPQVIAAYLGTDSSDTSTTVDTPSTEG
ncbi:ABC transporter ATP-binding protein [Auritidibacter ignavus]|uniref:ABC transporter ATP-binding protein n=1 Tax=Auritidibacter ignavus TaxID=678932 RepID=UPI000F02DE18|nr:ABC transporter ATP-binding protein [Auritidibacter ignavus]NIH72558.1 branched-chain amino acid transport system ATP-binding protein [Auritidibacter ignavus]RMX22631.1 ABC transporter ATP-binding protein [Auritidibacter ignavus]